jgi:hypothetical protein
MSEASGRSLMVVLDEELLVEVALLWLVVFVLWATLPSYGREGLQDRRRVGCPSGSEGICAGATYQLRRRTHDAN